MLKKILTHIRPIVRILFVLLIIALSAISVLFALRQGNKLPYIQSNSQGIPAAAFEPKTAISLYPETIVLTGTQSASIDITIDTNTNKVNFVQTELGYDPNSIEIITISPASFFANPVVLFEQNDTQTGRLSYALSKNPQSDSIQGKGVVARLAIMKNPTASPTAQTAITIQPKSVVTMQGVPYSVLKEMKGTIVTIN